MATPEFSAKASKAIMLAVEQGLLELLVNEDGSTSVRLTEKGRKKLAGGNDGH